MDAKRDWGYAKEYVEGMWRMLQAEKNQILSFSQPTVQKPFVIFVSMAFKAAGYTLRFEGKDENEVGIDTATGKKRWYV
ncbi:GDP-mannose 4,6-dehydratase [Escherichia coli]